MVENSNIDTPTIDAAFTYAVDTGEKIVNETLGDGDMGRRRTGVVEDKIMKVRNARLLRDTFDLETHGFVFVDHPIRMKDFFDADELRSVYYREAEELVKAQTGATRVHVFDHTLRSGDEDTRNEKLVRESVTRVHNDYTESSGPQRVRDLFPKEADSLLLKRFSIINVWKPIRVPALKEPLAICDARTIQKREMIPTDLRYTNRTGEIYSFRYSPDHRWLYFPTMQTDEAVLLKCYDSSSSGARFTAHTAVDDPNSPESAPHRQSIEVRTLAFF